MPETIKRLGAVNVTAAINTDVTLYICPANTFAAISFINACNMTTSGVSIRIAHIDGAYVNLISGEDYVTFDSNLNPRSNADFGRGLCMEAAECLMVRSSAVSTSFQAWGSEIS